MIDLAEETPGDTHRVIHWKTRSEQVCCICGRCSDQNEDFDPHQRVKHTHMQVAH